MLKLPAIYSMGFLYLGNVLNKFFNGLADLNPRKEQIKQPLTDKKLEHNMNFKKENAKDKGGDKMSASGLVVIGSNMEDGGSYLKDMNSLITSMNTGPTLTGMLKFKLLQKQMKQYFNGMTNLYMSSPLRNSYVRKTAVSVAEATEQIGYSTISISESIKSIAKSYPYLLVAKALGFTYDEKSKKLGKGFQSLQNFVIGMADVFSSLDKRFFKKSEENSKTVKSISNNILSVVNDIIKIGLKAVLDSALMTLAELGFKSIRKFFEYTQDMFKGIDLRKISYPMKQAHQASNDLLGIVKDVIGVSLRMVLLNVCVTLLGADPFSKIGVFFGKLNNFSKNMDSYDFNPKNKGIKSMKFISKEMIEFSLKMLSVCFTLSLLIIPMLLSVPALALTLVFFKILDDISQEASKIEYKGILKAVGLAGVSILLGIVMMINGLVFSVACITLLLAIPGILLTKLFFISLKDAVVAASKIKAGDMFKALVVGALTIPLCALVLIPEIIAAALMIPFFIILSISLNIISGMQSTIIQSLIPVALTAVLAVLMFAALFLLGKITPKMVGFALLAMLGFLAISAVMAAVGLASEILIPLLAGTLVAVALSALCAVGMYLALSLLGKITPAMTVNALLASVGFLGVMLAMSGAGFAAMLAMVGLAMLLPAALLISVIGKAIGPALESLGAISQEKLENSKAVASSIKSIFKTMAAAGIAAALSIPGMLMMKPASLLIQKISGDLSDGMSSLNKIGDLSGISENIKKLPGIFLSLSLAGLAYREKQVRKLSEAATISKELSKNLSEALTSFSGLDLSGVKQGIKNTKDVLNDFADLSVKDKVAEKLTNNVIKPLLTLGKAATPIEKLASSIGKLNSELKSLSSQNMENLDKINTYASSGARFSVKDKLASKKQESPIGNNGIGAGGDLESIMQKVYDKLCEIEGNVKKSPSSWSKAKA